MEIILNAIPEVLGAFIGSMTMYYVFNKQVKNEKERILKANQLQWLKELIITPNIDKIYAFFDEIEKEAQELRQPDAEKPTINAKIKELRRRFIKDFINLLQVAENKTQEIGQDTGYKQAKKNIEKLQDGITTVMYDDMIDLTDRTQYEKYISNEISATKNATIQAICKSFSV